MLQISLSCPSYLVLNVRLRIGNDLDARGYWSGSFGLGQIHRAQFRGQVDVGRFTFVHLVVLLV